MKHLWSVAALIFRRTSRLLLSLLSLLLCHLWSPAANIMPRWARSTQVWPSSSMLQYTWAPRHLPSSEHLCLGSHSPSVSPYILRFLYHFLFIHILSTIASSDQSHFNGRNSIDVLVAGYWFTCAYNTCII